MGEQDGQEQRLKTWPARLINHVLTFSSETRHFLWLAAFLCWSGAILWLLAMLKQSADEMHTSAEGLRGLAVLTIGVAAMATGGVYANRRIHYDTDTTTGGILLCLTYSLIMCAAWAAIQLVLFAMLAGAYALFDGKWPGYDLLNANPQIFLVVAGVSAFVTWQIFSPGFMRQNGYLHWLIFCASIEQVREDWVAKRAANKTHK